MRNSPSASTQMGLPAEENAIAVAGVDDARVRLRVRAR